MAERESTSKYLFWVGRFALLVVVAVLLGSAIGLAVVFFHEGRILPAIVSVALGLFSAAALSSFAARCGSHRRCWRCTAAE